MGNIVLRHKREPEIKTPEIVELSLNQIEIIKSTWAIPAAKPYDSGEKVLYAYFDQYPHNQEKFLAFKNTPLLMLKGTPGFRAHASRIMNVISSIVDSLDKDHELTAIKKIIAEVGNSHVRKRISKKAFVELRQVLLEILTEVCHLDDEGKEAWELLFNILCNVLFECLDGRSDQFFQ